MQLEDYFDFLPQMTFGLRERELVLKVFCINIIHRKLS
jgi:hypothetical protein